MTFEGQLVVPDRTIVRFFGEYEPRAKPGTIVRIEVQVLNFARCEAVKSRSCEVCQDRQWPFRPV